MLTRAQIQRLAQRHQMGMQVQERDDLQTCFSRCSIPVRRR